MSHSLLHSNERSQFCLRCRCHVIRMSISALYSISHAHDKHHHIRPKRLFCFVLYCFVYFTTNQTAKKMNDTFPVVRKCQRYKTNTMKFSCTRQTPSHTSKVRRCDAFVCFPCISRFGLRARFEADIFPDITENIR